MEAHGCCDVTLYRLVNGYRTFESVWSFHLQGQTFLEIGFSDPEDKGTTNLRNFGNYLPVDTEEHLDRLVSSATPL